MYILFLLNADVERSSKRLSIIDVYLTHLTDNSSAHSDGTFVVRNCTGRQKRLVAYHKIFRHIFGKGEYGVRRKLPACACNVVQSWYPDDADDAVYQGQI